MSAASDRARAIPASPGTNQRQRGYKCRCSPATRSRTASRKRCCSKRSRATTWKRRARRGAGHAPGLLRHAVGPGAGSLEAARIVQPARARSHAARLVSVRVNLDVLNAQTTVQPLARARTLDGSRGISKRWLSPRERHWPALARWAPVAVLARRHGPAHLEHAAERIQSLPSNSMSAASPANPASMACTVARPARWNRPRCLRARPRAAIAPRRLAAAWRPAPASPSARSAGRARPPACAAQQATRLRCASSSAAPAFARRRFQPLARPVTAATTDAIAARSGRRSRPRGRRIPVCRIAPAWFSSTCADSG